MRLLVDMNLSPQWVDVLDDGGFEAVHWSEVGAGDAPDRALMEWAKRKECTVFTHDLDFSALLASTQASKPSVIQLRTDDVLPGNQSALVVRALRRFESELKEGAILSIDLEQSRVRYLPLGE
jgi:predicted nuclease of predicted toxin-antitoxin system